jgi:sugar phosphate isomerase/epimerase
VNLAFHTGAWGTDHIFQALNAVGAAGIRHVEVFADVATVYDSKAEEFQFFLRKAGLGLVGAYGGGVFTDPDFRESDTEAARALARWVRSAGGSLVILQGGDRSAEPDRDVQAAAATANVVGQACRDEGVQFAFQPHVGTCIFEESEIRRFLGFTSRDLVGLCADTGHLAEAGVDLVPFMTEVAGRVRVVHLRDVRPKPVFVGGPFANPGKGTLQLPAAVAALRAAGFRGALVGFADDPREDPARTVLSFADFAEKKFGAIFEGA